MIANPFGSAFTTCLMFVLETLFFRVVCLCYFKSCIAPLMKKAYVCTVHWYKKIEKFLAIY